MWHSYSIPHKESIASPVCSHKPTVVMQVVPCVPASDQKFWADLVWRRGLGPRWFSISQLSVPRLAAGLEEGLRRLDELTRTAEELAVALHRENGVEDAIAVIEEAVGALHVPLSSAAG
jgi:hypothetical protein